MANEFSRPDRQETHHKTFSCNFWGVHHIYFLIIPDYLLERNRQAHKQRAWKLKNLPYFHWFFCSQSQQKFSLLVDCKCGWNNTVYTGLKAKPACSLSEILILVHLLRKMEAGVVKVLHVGHINWIFSDILTTKDQKQQSRMTSVALSHRTLKNLTCKYTNALSVIQVQCN